MDFLSWDLLPTNFNPPKNCNPPSLCAPVISFQSITNLFFQNGETVKAQSKGCQDSNPPNSMITPLVENVVINVSSVHGEIEQGEPSIKKAKQTAERSWVWGHFTKCTVKEMVDRVIDGKKVKVEENVLKAKFGKGFILDLYIRMQCLI